MHYSRTTSYSLRAILAACAPAICFADPVLTTPGTATWETYTTDTGSKTVFTIADDSVFEWNEFQLDEGSEVVFDFVGGNGVVNYITGSGYNFIDGTVTGNGSVSFISPNGDLSVGGSITADTITLSTLDANPADLINGGTLTLAGGAGRFLSVSGQLNATSGDLILAGEGVYITRGAHLSASNGVRVAGGSEVVVGHEVGGSRIAATGEEGWVANFGTIRSGKIEVRAGAEVANAGTLDASTGQVFLEVGGDGRIYSDSDALIVGEVIFDGVIRAAPAINRFEADAPAVISEATLRIPELKSPGGQVVTKTVKVNMSSAVTASVSAEEKRQPAKRSAEPILARSSFFGMRGGRGGSQPVVSGTSKR